jgi:hypothetical protein
MRFLAFLPVAVLAAACGSASKAPPDPSTVSGSAAATTFPSAPSAVTATDEGGRAVRAPVAADGSFSLALAKSHTYTLAFATPTGNVSIVFPRATGKLDKSFTVKSDGALVRLGRVHYLAKAPAGGFHVTSAAGGTTPKTEQTGESGDQGNCVDCVNDDGKTSCEAGGEGGSTAESSSSEATSSETATEAEADPTQEMAVGDQNAPDQVDGCGGEGADGADGADVQQEGDHTDPGDPAGSP